jgi:hypothetical protein
MQRLKYFFLVVDIGFIVYWGVILFQLLPEEYLFNDYHNPILVAWNWSFLPLDLAISATGLTSLALWRRGKAQWRSLALISLVLTFCSGLQAITFWALRLEFDPTWWLPNLFLLIYPLFFIPGLVRTRDVVGGQLLQGEKIALLEWSQCVNKEICTGPKNGQ